MIDTNKPVCIKTEGPTKGLVGKIIHINPSGTVAIKITKGRGAYKTGTVVTVYRYELEQA
jgi:hypothetical protein